MSSQSLILPPTGGVSLNPPTAPPPSSHGHSHDGVPCTGHGHSHDHDGGGHGHSHDAGSAHGHSHAQALTKPPPFTMQTPLVPQTQQVSDNTNLQQAHQPPPTFASTFAQPPTQIPATSNISAAFNLPTTAHLFNPAAVGGSGIAAFNPIPNYFNPSNVNLQPPTNMLQQLNLNDKVFGA